MTAGDQGTGCGTAGSRSATPPPAAARLPEDEDVAQLIDSPALQNLMDCFHKFSGLATAIIDLQGRILVASGWQEICSAFHRVHPETCRNCVESDVALSANLNEGRYAVYRCKNLLWDMATPVVVGGRHVANVFGGQFLFEDEPVDTAAFERQAERYGFDREAYLAALAKVPRVSRERARDVMEFYVALAGLVVKLGQGTMDLRAALREQARAEEERRLRDIFDHAAVGIFRTAPDGSLVYANAALAALFGYSGPAELTGAIRNVAEAYARPEQRDENIRRVASSAEPIWLESEFRRKGGETFLGDLRVRAVRDEQGQVVALEGFLDDITERKRAEAAKAHLASIIESSTDAILGKDLDGTIRSWNKGAEITYGYTAAEIIGKPVSVLAPPDRKQETAELLARLARGETVSYLETIRVRKDGQPIEVSLAVSPIRDAQGRIVGASTIARDITAHRRAEREVRAASLYARSLIEASLDPLVTISPEGKITDVNRATEEATGATRAELIGTDFADYFTEPDRARTGYQEALARGYVRDFPLTMRHRSGLAIEVLYNASVYRNERGERQGVFAAARDVTERVRIEEALRASERRLTEAQRIAHLGNWELDIASNTLIWSAEIYRMFEVDPAAFDASYDAFLAAIHPEDRELVSRAYRDSVENRTRYDIVHRLLMKDGRVKYVNEQCETSYDAAGRPVRSIGTVQEITDRKRAEEALQRMESQLRQSQKLEAVGRLAGGVAHDFNNLLTAILSGSDQLLQRLLASDPLREDAEDIHEAALKAASLTRQLLTFSRKQVVQPKVVELDDIVGGLDRMLRRLIGEDVELVTIAGGETRVKVDPGQMEQVIVNLVVNARDSMARGGRITVETAAVELGEEAATRHVPLAPGPYVMLAVTDTGCGMSPEVQAHLFEPFFTTKDSGRGTGLGLSTVYGIVRQAGGNVWVYSEPGQGSVFKVYLPRVTEAAEAPAPVPAGPVAGGHETVLVVEDEPLVRRLAVKVLRSAGYTVLEAEDGEEGLRVAEAQGASPIEVLVTDTVMPRLGGDEMARRLKLARPGIRVLFMSGYADHGAALQRQIDEGAAFLQKPFSASALVRRVRDLLDADGRSGAR